MILILLHTFVPYFHSQHHVKRAWVKTIQFSKAKQRMKNKFKLMIHKERQPDDCSFPGEEAGDLDPIHIGDGTIEAVSSYLGSFVEL